MTRRVLLLLLLLFFSASLWLAKGQTIKVVEKPKALPEEVANIPVRASSFDGRYFYGSHRGKAFVWDSKEDKVRHFDDEVYSYEIVNVSRDGEVLIQTAKVESMQSGLSDELRFYSSDVSAEPLVITSPESDFPYFNLWYMSANASYFCGSLSSEAWTSIPILGVRKADGKSFDVIKLPAPEKDPLGLEPQQIRMIHVDEEGNRVTGFLLDHSGFVSSVILYTKQQDGSYKYSFPANELLFDTSVVIPPYPEYEDYVTVPTDPEDPNYNESELEKQEKVYNEAVDNYYKQRDRFTKDLSLQHYTLSIVPDGKTALATVVHYSKDEEGFSQVDAIKYIKVDLLKGTASMHDFPKSIMEAQVTPLAYIGSEGDILCAIPEVMYWNAMVLTNTGSFISFVEWLKEKSGEDFSEFYTTARPANPDENMVLTGWPRVSGDGKTIAFLGYSSKVETTWYSTYLRLEKNVLAVPHITKPTNEEILRFDGKRLHLKGASALTIYTLEGENVFHKDFSKEGSESLELGHLLPTGCYIATATTAHGTYSTLKLCF